MTKNINQRPLFIFEMANNHQGSLEHGLRIIREIYEVSKNFPFNFAFKLQARDIPTFIHPDYQGREDIKYVKRFSETKLSEEDYKVLKNEIDKLGFISICTPFDENSVDLIERLDFDIIKVGSPSFLDWPLLERIAKTDKPLIISLGGAPLEEIDKVVSFLEHREKKFILMHCVGEYPTISANLQLNQIDLLRQRYPQIEIGYSTHESPDNFESIKIAIAKGANVFEKHVGIKTEKISLNDYSATPEQVKQWLLSAKEAFDACGVIDKRASFSEKELSDLRQFKRGVFARKPVKKGEKISLSEVFLAWPNKEGQLLASDMSKYVDYLAEKDIKENAPIFFSEVKASNKRKRVYEIITKTRKMLEEAKIFLTDKLDIEVSHHYGIDNFHKYGAVIINCVNREYCKKLLVLFPGQSHPTHFHKKKEETFQILSGDLIINLDGEEKEYKPGDVVLVPRGAKHSFRTKNGAIFEEVSTTHFKNDSFYEDSKIAENKNRKTELTYWLKID